MVVLGAASGMQAVGANDRLQRRAERAAVAQRDREAGAAEDLAWIGLLAVLERGGDVDEQLVQATQHQHFPADVVQQVLAQPHLVGLQELRRDRFQLCRELLALLLDGGVDPLRHRHQVERAQRERALVGRHAAQQFRRGTRREQGCEQTELVAARGERGVEHDRLAVGLQPHVEGTKAPERVEAEPHARSPPGLIVLRGEVEERLEALFELVHQPEVASHRQRGRRRQFRGARRIGEQLRGRAEHVVTDEHHQVAVDHLELRNLRVVGMPHVERVLTDRQIGHLRRNAEVGDALFVRTPEPGAELGEVQPFGGHHRQHRRHLRIRQHGELEVVLVHGGLVLFRQLDVQRDDDLAAIVLEEVAHQLRPHRHEVARLELGVVSLGQHAHPRRHQRRAQQPTEPRRTERLLPECRRLDAHHDLRVLGHEATQVGLVLRAQGDEREERCSEQATEHGA